MLSTTTDSLKAGALSPFKDTSAADKRAELTSAAEFSISSDDTGSNSDANYIRVRPLIFVSKATVHTIREPEQRHGS
jgi:hypothetical protein